MPITSRPKLPMWLANYITRSVFGWILLSIVGIRGRSMKRETVQLPSTRVSYIFRAKFRFAQLLHCFSFPGESSPRGIKWRVKNAVYGIPECVRPLVARAQWSLLFRESVLTTDAAGISVICNSRASCDLTLP